MLACKHFSKACSSHDLLSTRFLLAACALQTRVKILRRIASDLAANEQLIMERNMRDVASAERKKLDSTLLQRLKLKPEKIRTLVKGIQAIADQEEPLRKVWHARSFLRQAPLRQGCLVARVAAPDSSSALTCSAWPELLLDPLPTASQQWQYWCLACLRPW